MLVQLFSSIQFDEKTDQNKYTWSTKVKKAALKCSWFYSGFCCTLDCCDYIGLDWVFIRPKISLLDTTVIQIE